MLSEDERILDYFVARVPKCHSLEEVGQLLEALYFEQKIRIGDKAKFADQLRASLDKQAASFRQAESVIKRSNLCSSVNYEIKLFKQLNEIKTLRHAGLYLDKAILKKTDDSEIYDWIVDIDLITSV